MTKFWHNNTTIQEEDGELECEEAIIGDKKEFGRVRKSMMNVLRAKYSDEIANRTLNRVNKRMQKGHLSIL